MKDKPLTEQEKQFTVMPNEIDPRHARVAAHQAAVKALGELRKNKPPVVNMTIDTNRK